MPRKRAVAAGARIQSGHYPIMARPFYNNSPVPPILGIRSGMLRVLLMGPEDALLRDFLAKVPGLEKLEVCEHVTQYLAPAELSELLERIVPDAVLISLADYNRAVRAIARLAAARPHLPIIALHTYCDQHLLLELMQVGARELWFQPFQVEQITQSLSRLGQQREAVAAATAQEPVTNGTLIAFLPARGGCGTTTVAVHTAAVLQQATGSALLADFDFHNSIIAFWMKLSPRHGFQEALERAHWLDASQWRGLVSHVGPLEVLTAPQTASPMAFSGDETSAVLEFACKNYQFVLVDLPDAIYSSCWEVLEQASQIFLVATPEMASLYLARRKISQLVDHGLSRDKVRILLSRCTPLDVQPAEVEKFLSLPVVASFGNQYRAVATAFSDGALVSQTSKLGTQLARFAHSLAGVSETKEKETKQRAWKIRQLFSPA